MLKWEEETGAVSVWRRPSDFGNGNTRDRQGRLVPCEHGGRRVIRPAYDGSLAVPADNALGKSLQSPNHVVVKSDDSVPSHHTPYSPPGTYSANHEHRPPPHP